MRGMSHINIPLHAVSNMIESLVKNGQYIIGNIYNYSMINSDDQIIEFTSGSLVKALFALAILDDNGSLAAFSIAEFREDKDFSDPAIFECVYDALDTLNRSIRSIVINENFKNEISHRGDH